MCRELMNGLGWFNEMLQWVKADNIEADTEPQSATCNRQDPWMDHVAAMDNDMAQCQTF